MTAKTTYTATYTTADGVEITAERTTNRTYSHAAVYQFGDKHPVIGSFHSTEALALKGTLTADQKAGGVKVIAAVPATVKTDAPAADTAPVETPKTTVKALSDRVDAAKAAAKTPKARKSAKPKTDATPTTADIEKAAAELATETPEPVPTNGHAVVEFFRHLADTGVMNEKTSRNYVGLFRSVISGGHARGLNADVTKINVDSVWDRYIAATPTLLDSTAKVYRQFYSRAVKLFLEYLANPEGWTPTGRSEARRPRQAHTEFTLADGSTLRVTHTPGTDLKAALDEAVKSLDVAPVA
jgi:hypothetical protein